MNNLIVYFIGKGVFACLSGDPCGMYQHDHQQNQQDRTMDEMQRAKEAQRDKHHGDRQHLKIAMPRRATANGKAADQRRHAKHQQDVCSV